MVTILSLVKFEPACILPIYYFPDLVHKPKEEK